jgi:uncharacterized small protein (DUF1192 family)
MRILKSSFMSTISEGLRQEFLDREDNKSQRVSISQKFQALKIALGCVAGDRRAPFPWLSKFGEQAMHLYLTIIPNARSDVLSPTANLQPTSIESFCKMMPFSKISNEIPPSLKTPLIENNYYFHANPKFSREDLNLCLLFTGFAEGYLATCRECAAVGVLWGALYEDEANESMEDKIMRLLVQDGKVLKANELQARLALALTRIYRAKALAKPFDRGMLVQEIDRLIGLLRDEFPSLYATLCRRHAPRDSGVWQWFSPPLHLAMLHMQIHFLLGSGWIICKVVPALILSTPDSTPEAVMDGLSDAILLLNMHSLSHAENTQMGMQILQTLVYALQAFAMALKNVEYTPFAHLAQGPGNNDLALAKLFCLPFVALTPFLQWKTTALGAKSKLLRIGKGGLTILAGMISSVDFYTGLRTPGLYRRFLLEGTRALYTAVTNPKLHQDKTGLWIQEVHRQTRKDASLLTMTASTHRRCQGDTREACKTVVQFTRFFNVNRMLQDSSSKKSHANAKYELELFHDLLNEQIEVRNAIDKENEFEKRRANGGEWSQQEGATQNSGVYSGLRSVVNGGVAVVSNNMKHFDPYFYKSSGGDRTKTALQSATRADVLAVFRSIEGLWDYLFLDQPQNSPCVLLEYREDAETMRRMIPSLLQTVEISVADSGVLKNETERKSLPPIISQILYDRVNEGTLCKFFTFPDEGLWRSHEEVYHTPAEIHSLRQNFTDGFQGFEQLPHLTSEDELKTLLQRYRDFQLPDKWGPHLTVEAHSSSLPLLLTLLLQKKTVDGPFHGHVNPTLDKQGTEKAYALGMLNMLNGVGASQSTLLAVDKALAKKGSSHLGPAAFFATHYAARHSAPAALTVQALKYLGAAYPMPVNAVRKKLTALGANLSKGTTLPLPAPWGLEMRGEPSLLLKSKSLAPLHACALLPLHPTPLLLQRWLRAPDPAARSTMKKYYAVNPDILTASVIHDLSLLTALKMTMEIHERAEQTLKVQNRLRQTMVFAREELMVSTKQMLSLMLFISDYFALYNGDGECDAAQQDDVDIAVHHLQALLDSEERRDEKFVAQGMLKIMGEGWQKVAPTAENLLLQTVREFFKVVYSEVYRVDVSPPDGERRMQRPPPSYAITRHSPPTVFQSLLRGDSEKDLIL